MLRIFSAQDRETASKALSKSERATAASEDCIYSSRSKLTIDVVFIKGAPDVLLPRCTSILMPNGDTVPLTSSLLQELTDLQYRWSISAQRVLLLARRIISYGDLKEKDLESSDATDRLVRSYTGDLVIVGLIGIIDPPRPDIPEVVRVCRGAGIRFFMVTGDHAKTAEAVARQVGIITAPSNEVRTISQLRRDPATPVASPPTEKDNGEPLTPRSLVISGTELITLNEAQWTQLCGYEEIVFARTTPEQKLRIVREFQSRDNSVGMTGDGVNDAPSLKAADIGIAMGSGSDVAIEAADMVLLDSFSAVLVAIKYGRLLFDNLKKTIIYLLPAGSFSELWPVLLNVFFGAPQILSSFLMIIICTLTDCVAALTLVFEKPEADLLTRPPRNRRTDRLANPKLIFHAYGFIGIIECATSMVMGFWYISRQGIPFSVVWFSFGNYPPEYDPDTLNYIFNVASSIYFVNLVIMQFFNLMATRTRRLSILQQPPFFRSRTSNYFLIPAMLFALCVGINSFFRFSDLLFLVFFFLYIPWWENIIGTTAIPVENYFFPVAFGLFLLLADELVNRQTWRPTNYSESILCGDIQKAYWRRLRGKMDLSYVGIYDRRSSSS